MDQMMEWWKSQLSGLEIDSCPATDLPDNDLGGSFAAWTSVQAGPAGRDLLTAAFAYTLGKYTAQQESLFWIREEGRCYPFYISFDENAPPEGGAGASGTGRSRAGGGAADQPGDAPVL